MRPMIRHYWTFLVLLLSSNLPVYAEPEYRAMGPDIFDRQVSGEVLIDQALVKAKKEDKRVLVFFGGNWCPWCRRLHRLFEEAPALVARLRKEFVLVQVDANFRRDKNRNATLLKRYGDPIKQYGLPVFVVLDRDGAQLTTQETNSLAAPTDEETVKQIDKFMERWAPPAKPRL